jgi:hypothetical protein
MLQNTLQRSPLTYNITTDREKNKDFSGSITFPELLVCAHLLTLTLSKGPSGPLYPSLDLATVYNPITNANAPAKDHMQSNYHTLRPSLVKKPI